MTSELERVRRRLARERGPRYWRCLEELAESEAFGPAIASAFPRVDAVARTSVSRRDALKLMAAGMALGGLTACEGQPAEHLVPYVVQPEHVVPGRPRQYATTALVGGYGHGLLAESHEGRPTKLEGNPEHPATLGACDVFSQASVLGLYDPDRSATITRAGGIATVEALIAAVGQKRTEWDAASGDGLRIVTGALTSPSRLAALEALLERWPRARWHAFEPVDRSAVYEGARLAFGRPLEPVYRFDRAQLVVSLDADFLAAQPGFLRHAHDLMSRRRPRDGEPSRQRLVVAESTPTITGATADHRKPLAHDAIEPLARQLAAALGVLSAPPQTPAAAPRWVEAVAARLERHRGEALVVPGDQQPPVVHAIAHAINHALGAFGAVMDTVEPVDAAHAAASLDTLTRDIEAGAVTSLVVLDSNPVHTAPGELDFASAYRQVPWRLHWGEYADETAELSHWHVPAAHALEAWDDARAYDGTAGLVQPLIRPLHGGRTALQMLTLLAEGAERDARELVRAHWRRAHGEDGFEAFWRRSLRDGVVPDTRAAVVNAAPRAGWREALPAPGRRRDGLVLQFKPDPALWDGRHANNGWLQELPRPLTKLTWDNALLIAPGLAEARGLATGDVVRVDADRAALELPVFVLPGQPPEALTLHLGHGRRRAGRVALGVGTDAYALRSSAEPWAASATLTPTGERRQLATTQAHHSIEGRDLVRVADLARYRENPAFAHEPEPDMSLYPEPWPAERSAAHAWAMVIDLSACIGCNACVTACQAENNIPVVGAAEVARGREMHWIRVDRYFDGPPEAPLTQFQPVPCMHCENAPCEYVCPVEATQHSADGLNEMIYNRCIGTRYCSQNCPYKVRRFNWFDYTGRDAAHAVDPAVHNPDVTVRSRGVMEKCTYCVQRINAARGDADAAGRPLADGDVVTACQQACPTEAIVFGDLAAEPSRVRELKAHPLNYSMLGELNTRPRTTYLAAVRNPDPELDDDGP